MAVSHTFAVFSKKKLQATCEQWEVEAKAGLAFPTDIDQLLEWVRTHDTHQEADSMAYGVFQKGNDVADGIAEVVITRAKPRSPWIKLLRLRLKPSIDEGIYKKEIEAQSLAMDVFISAVAGVVSLTHEHEARTLKIFGRSNDQLSFLQTLAVELKKLLKEASIEIQGRWLVITVK